ncbi:TIGR03088 family PEP-CTERM/XrtA system glycosyltransferase [Catenovulum maritimum]|uniref:Glycosyltransferase subfamily 4-like N-terminal domain-containing protein n=1 Tax=Catenovulum maritimum TaxID=1513271 RepID=A0A0J8GTK9_9ALTE|nr:TIGR03088 family PEP-CTERM/XrtA system glycosyltransferase [Catenovulum maritimum]KMT64649.1 hypothetical protein XM47_13495 [Catenovulum maritimum]
MNERKHITHLVYRLDIGGLERVLINSINALPEDKYSHSIIALTEYSNDFANLINSNSVALYSINKPEGHSWKAFYQVYKLLKQTKPNVLHSYNLPTLEYQLCAFLARVPNRVHAEHGRDIYDPEGKNKKYQLLRRLISPFINKFVTVSKDLYDWLKDTVQITPKKCELIYNGVNTTSYQTADSKTLIHDSQNGKFVFGCVGRLQGIKDHQRLIKAYDIACSENENFANSTQLSIVGDGPLRAELEQQAQITKRNIWFAGARHDMADIYHSFDTFIMSSIGEGVPMTMLEAMASGLPVISTNVGGIPEITTAEMSILVPAKDEKTLSEAMLKMHSNNKHLVTMKVASRKLATENFSEQSMVNKYQNLYR